MKNSVKLITFSSLLILILLVDSFAQTADEMNQSRIFERQAITDYRANNFSGFLENIRKAGNLRPNHSRLLYNLAAAYAVNNNPNESLNILNQLAEMGLFFQIEKDNDFKSLFENDNFKRIQQQMNRNEQSLNNSKQAFSLNQRQLITEGIAYNPKTKTFYLSSIHQRKIIAVSADGKEQDFSTEADNLWSVSGMKVDAKRQILWVCSSVFPQMRGFKKEDDGKAGIFKYDLKNGKLLKSYLLSNETEKHALGDLTLNKKGDVFITDSVSPNIYFIDSTKDRLELFLKSDLFTSLQGADFSADEKTMFVADYGKGIFKINLQTKQITQLKPAKNVMLLGLDGFYFHQGKLIGIQNGINPNRVVSFQMNPQATEITGFTALEVAHPNFNEPTLGVIIDGELFYVANSQWGLVNEKAELQTDKLKNPVILKLRL